MIAFRPDSDELDALMYGNVDASRVNECMASPKSKRYAEYLQFVREQAEGEPGTDPNAQYRQRAKALLPMAVMAYEARNGVKLERHRLYQYRHPDEGLMPIVAVPDAMEGDALGITFHIRDTRESCIAAEQRGLDQAMLRHGHAMMLLCGTHYWLHCNYWQDAERGQRRLNDSLLVERNEDMANIVETALLEFAVKTRLRATA